jgi:hypothetical protein
VAVAVAREVRYVSMVLVSLVVVVGVRLLI